MLTSITPVSYAHGNRYEVLPKGVVGVKASFDTGEPMTDARVIIFAPNTSQVYFQTKSDKNGVVTFCPDKSGLWSLMIRDNSGHGMRVNLEIDDAMTVSMGQKESLLGTATLLQKIIMAGCVIWGFIGTALFFKRKQENNSAH